ncbi:hypothetical protein EMIT079MI2_140089 [Bacillus sp. IT-79MI2]
MVHPYYNRVLKPILIPCSLRDFVKKYKSIYKLKNQHKNLLSF